MSVDGSLIFDTAISTEGFEAGLAQLQASLAGLGESLMASGPTAEQAAVLMQAVCGKISAGGQRMTALAQAAAGGVVAAFGSMAGSGAAMTGQMMAGMLSSMNGMAGALYQKANEIASGIISTFNRAFAIRSPSKVMQDIFGMVMAGAQVGLTQNERALYQKAEQVAAGVVGGFERQVGAAAGEWNRQLRQAVAAPVMRGPAGAATGGAANESGGATSTQYHYHVTVNGQGEMSAEALSREMEEMTRRMAWQVP